MLATSGSRTSPPATLGYIVRRTDGVWHVPVSEADLLEIGSGFNVPQIAVNASGAALLTVQAYDAVDAEENRVWIGEFTPD